VEKHYDKSICQLSVDVEKIKLSFLNIIVNAIEAMEKDKGVLTITTYNAGSKCIIDFGDNGMGMDPKPSKSFLIPILPAKRTATAWV
jgi:nitrogen-specific signal transduction histidine kinase